MILYIGIFKHLSTAFVVCRFGLHWHSLFECIRNEPNERHHAYMYTFSNLEMKKKQMKLYGQILFYNVFSILMSMEHWCESLLCLEPIRTN